MFAQGHGTPADYKEVNMKESRDLADAFLAYEFLDGQYKFLKSKGKSQMKIQGDLKQNVLSPTNHFCGVIGIYKTQAV